MGKVQDLSTSNGSIVPGSSSCAPGKNYMEEKEVDTDNQPAVYGVQLHFDDPEAAMHHVECEPLSSSKGANPVAGSRGNTPKSRGNTPKSSQCVPCMYPTR